VFPDKEALIRSAVEAALDPAPLLEDLASIDPNAPLRERVTQATRILQRRLISIVNLLSAVGMHRPPDDIEEHRRTVRPTNELIHAALARVLQPDHDAFRYPVEEVARLLRLLTFTGSHPLITDGHLLSPEEIVALLLDGTLARPASS
jgi:AcrR family transcriptional regulator